MEVEGITPDVGEKLETEVPSERWFSLLALTTVILAVCATLSSFKEGNNSVDSVLGQTQASDQWAYYQSKSIKSYLYEMQKEKLELDLQANQGTFSAEIMSRYEKKIARYGEEIARYAKEKADIMEAAKKCEKGRDDAQRRAEAYGIAVIFLQMGILLSSISALMKRKMPWIVGCVVGVVGIVFFLNGLLLFM